jgi:hypothetical protein
VLAGGLRLQQVVLVLKTYGLIPRDVDVVGCIVAFSTFIPPAPWTQVDEAPTLRSG